MTMEELFSFPRFKQLLRNDLKTAWQNMRFSLILMSCVNLFTYLLGLILRWALLPADGFVLTLDARTNIYYIMALTLCVVTPSRCFGSLTEQRAGRFFLLQPASVVEKVLSMILTGLLVLLTATIINFGWDWLICRLEPVNGTPLINILGSVMRSSLDGTTLYLGFLLGAILFKKNKIGKPALAFALLWILLNVFFPAPERSPWIFNILFPLILTGLIFWRVRTLQH